MNETIRLRIRVPTFLLGFTLLLLAGCKQQTMYVYLPEAGGLSIDSPVQHRWNDVGTIRALHGTRGGVRLEFRLEPEKESVVEPGMRARIARTKLGLGEPVLKLYGRPQGDMPVFSTVYTVPDGIVFANPLLNTYSISAVLFGAGCMLVLLLLKGTRKVLLCLIIVIAVAGGAFWFFTSGGKGHGDRVLPPDVQKRWDESAEKTIQSPEAQDAWEKALEGLADAFSEAKEKGAEAVVATRETLCTRLERKAAELNEQGKHSAAAELTRLKDRLANTSDATDDTSAHDDMAE